MYLSDREIEALLPELKIECADPEHPFQASEQVQPCSIDLRLSNVFWEPVSGKAIDLRKARLLDLEPRLLWRRRELRKGESITLRPGKLLLGRVHERLTIPPQYAGKVEGRSSFARLGLGVHCAADFLNPGYSGHMPLQLLNFSPHPITLVPYIPICQLMLGRLSSLPSRSYGHVELQSKYMDDDGGPSYWWRDRRIRSLQARLHDVDISLRIQEEILDRIGAEEPDLLERFESFVAAAKPTTRENADTLLVAFVGKEKRLRMWDRLRRGIAYAIFPILGSAGAGSIFVRPFALLHHILWTATILSALPFLHVLRTDARRYLVSEKQRTGRQRT